MGEATPTAAQRAVALGLIAAAVAGLIYAGAAPQRETPEAETALPAAAPEETAAAPADTAAAPEAATEAPSFDLVRVEPDGSAAVAGTAAPDARVTIYADGAPLAEVEADAAGNFVAILRVEPSTAPQALTLGAVAPEGGTATTSEDVVMLLPRAPDTPRPDGGPAAGGAPAAAADPGAPEPSEPAEEAVPEVAATAIVRADAVEVPPPPGDPAAPRRVALASISYAETGEVSLAGTGTAGAELRAYVDGAFAEAATVADDGRWRMELGDVSGGLYRLRIDQIGTDGQVASRVETPFQRDYPQAPPPRPGAPAAVQAGEVSVTVQPGHNLWTLARTHYGSGVLYTQIFTANRELIRNPDLIYPGQIFTVPAPKPTE
jgi:nucleoid-associated protein YgaU